MFAFTVGPINSSQLLGSTVVLRSILEDFFKILPRSSLNPLTVHLACLVKDNTIHLDMDLTLKKSTF